MKKSTISESQILKMLKEYESGREVMGICREYGVSRATFYNWKKKYSGMDGTEIKRLKELESENQRLKRMYADLSLDHQMLKEILGKKF
jgi:putative transposase